jgi:DNA-directed RNA polymerase sigma subunit (sigma70/sigma32)
MNDDALYDEWKTAPPSTKDAALAKLLANLSGVVGSAVNTYRAAPLPFQILELEAKASAVDAIRSWEAKKGMSLASYVGTMVRNDLHRYVGTHQNVARIPEHQIQRIGPFNAAVSELSNRFGREPTTHEVADHLGVGVKHVTTLRKMLRKDLAISGEDSDSITDIEHDPDYERALMAYYSLSPQEKTVFDYTFGAHGQPKMKPSEMAAKLGVSPARISAVKESIGKKLNPYLRPS